MTELSILAFVLAFTLAGAFAITGISEYVRRWRKNRDEKFRHEWPFGS